MVPLDYQVLQAQLVIYRLLIDELLHKPLVVEEPRLELAVSVRFHQTGTAFPLSVQEILGNSHVILLCMLLKNVVVRDLSS